MRCTIKILALAPLVLLVSCSSFPVSLGASLAAPSVPGRAIDRKVWLEQVEIAGSEEEEIGLLEDALTLNICEYVQKAGYFREVVLSPGDLAEGDLVLRFRFNQYSVRRRLMPAGVSLLILTLGFYGLFGGPLSTDTGEFSAQLSVNDFKGNRVVWGQASEQGEYSNSMYSTTTSFPSGIRPRTRLVGSLLDDVIRELGKGGRTR